MKYLKKFGLLSLTSTITLMMHAPLAFAQEGWNDELNHQEAAGRFDWIRVCHPYLLVDMWERMHGTLDGTDNEKIVALEQLLIGNQNALPQYLTFGKKDFSNPDNWFAGTSKAQPCKALPQGYKVLGAISSFNLPKYCPSEPRFGGFVSVNQVSFGGQKYTSGFSKYSNQSNRVFTLKRNQSSPYSLAAGFGSQNTQANWKVWIDYNQDGDFKDAGELVIHEYNNPINGSLRVPTTAKTGYTKMRLQASYSGGTTDPCGQFFAGEVEDYVVYIN